MIKIIPTFLALSFCSFVYGQDLDNLRKCAGLYYFLKQNSPSISDQDRYTKRLNYFESAIQNKQSKISKADVDEINKQYEKYISASSKKILTYYDVAKDEDYCSKF